MKMAEALSADDQSLVQCVTFELENETYGINVMQVQEVLRETEVAPVPGAPHYVIGIINLRGNVVSVIDARRRFGLSPVDKTDLTRIIVIEVMKQIIGILVDSVAEVVDVKVSDIETAPNVGNDETSRYIDGVVSKDDKLLILVDLNKLLTEAELGSVSGF
jgi:purine-binding chemotaxis protein CheW